MTEAARLWIIALMAASLVEAADAPVVVVVALAASFGGSVTTVRPSRASSSSRMLPSCAVDLSFIAAAYSIAAS